jgi:flagellar hook-associated protein 2
MEVESEPLDNLENDKEYYESQLDTYSSFNDLLGSLVEAVDEIDTLTEIASYAATVSGDEVISATTSSDAVPGSYEVQVLNLAQTQKDVSSEGFADADDASLSGSITIDGSEISYENVSLSDLIDMINDADTGYTAGMINDGTDDGWRLVLTGDSAANSADILATGSITIDTASDGHTRDAALAHVQIDGIDIYSEHNTVTDGIYGVTLDLLSSSEDSTSYVKVATDTDAVTTKINDFISAYNEIITFIDEVAETSGSTNNDLSGVVRNLRGFLTQQFEGESVFNSLASLGFETDFQTGELSIDSTTLSDALEDDFDSVLALFAGDDENEGLFARVYAYLDEQTDSISGFYVTREESLEAKIERIDESIERMETRLEKREETLTAQFNALELLMSELNSSSDYLTTYFSS